MVFLFKSLYAAYRVKEKKMRRPEVLRNKKDFSAIYSRGKSLGDRYVVIFYRNNSLDYTRTAFLASKKVGKSVQRNRARRLMKESYRCVSENIKNSIDVIFIARNTINDASFVQVRKSLINALIRAKLMEKENGVTK